jgi:hypothetical protein
VISRQSQDGAAEIHSPGELPKRPSGRQDGSGGERDPEAGHRPSCDRRGGKHMKAARREQDLPYESDQDLTDEEIAMGLMEITALSFADVLEDEPAGDQAIAARSLGIAARYFHLPRIQT